ncbi:MAG: TetR/AcrR family transcriptional regulator [Chitinophagales bacterium]|nr:TetR/AcrR family transcriptional regulator [Chitinophagales bacterium]MCZ2394785.1 TetR/AcrR family transcriptional regulator [Chitinophagales bacterium]
MNVLSEVNNKKIETLFLTTLDLVANYGFHGTSMSMISKESGIAIGTIYHYFKSKDELISSVLNYAKKKGMEASFGMDDSQKDYYSRFKLIWTHLYEHLIAHPEMMSFINQFYSSPYCRQIDDDTYCFQGELSLFIKEAERDNIIKENIPHHIISSIFLGSVVNSARDWIKNHNKLDEIGIKALIDIIWEGIKK